MAIAHDLRCAGGYQFDDSAKTASSIRHGYPFQNPAGIEQANRCAEKGYTGRFACLLACNTA